MTITDAQREGRTRANAVSKYLKALETNAKRANNEANAAKILPRAGPRQSFALRIRALASPALLPCGPENIATYESEAPENTCRFAGLGL